MLLFLLSIADDDTREKVEEIYRKYHIPMFKVAKYKLRGRPNAAEEAEEALQNAFVKIIEHFDSIRLDESERCLHAYFLAIATNEAINIINGQSDHTSLHEVENVLPMAESDFLDKLCLESDYDRVVRAIAALDDRYSIPLQLMYVNQLSVEQIASRLHMKPKTVYTQISRGKQQLLKILNERSVEYEGKYR